MLSNSSSAVHHDGAHLYAISRASELDASSHGTHTRLQTSGARAAKRTAPFEGTYDSPVLGLSVVVGTYRNYPSTVNEFK
jgi:hypothetical protein